MRGKTGIAFLISFFFIAIISTRGFAVEKAATGVPALPDGFIVLSPEKMNWSDAEAYCARQGGKLPRINDSAAWNGGVIFIDGFGTIGSYWPEGLPTDAYWTGTKHADFTDVAWVVAYYNYVVALSDEQNKTYRAVCVPIDSSSAEKLSEIAALETQQAMPRPFTAQNQEPPPVASGSDGNVLTGTAAMSISDFIELCKTGSAQQINDALKVGADVNAKSQYGSTPLMWASRDNSNPEAIAALIHAGADVNARDDVGETPLMWAAQHNSNPEVITALIKAGADVNEKDKYIWTPLLMWAIARDANPEVMATLMEAGADVNDRNEEGCTPLLYAVSAKPAELITILVKSGADVNAKDERGRTPLMRAASDNPNPEMITTLVKLGADVNARDDRGETPLMHAALFSPNPDVITVLIKEGADVNAKAEDGSTPLILATLNIKMVKIGDAVNVKDGRYEYTSPLFRMINNTEPKVITALVKAGADVNAKDEQGTTPLMCAALSANPSVITVLLKLGANPKAQDKSGKKAIDYAKEDRKSTNTDGIKILEDVSR